MKSIFVKMLFSFFVSLLVFLAIMTSIFLLGFKRSVADWGIEKRKTIEEQIQNELKNILAQDNIDTQTLLNRRISSLIPQNLYLIVYDSDKNVIYVHKGVHYRGRGKMRREDFGEGFSSRLALKTVSTNGKIIGYYSIGSMVFGLDKANARFLESMQKTVLISIAFAFILAFLFAFFSSKKFADSAKSIANGINKISRGKLSVRIPEKGASEISLIAKSANELGRRLEKEEALRRQWASDIAHDLRTPISALKSQLEGMVDGALDFTKERVIKNLKELSRIEFLVNDLGELTILESPEMKIHPTRIDVDNFFQELNNRFECQFNIKNISVGWEKKVDVFIADGNLIQRAVSNFISNAIRHTDKGGKINVAIRNNGNGYVITVFNTGRGIPMGEIKKVFDRLYRGEYARETAGSGLGLTIAQKIAELHGGKVIINSKENYGTTVEMLIKAFR